MFVIPIIEITMIFVSGMLVAHKVAIANERLGIMIEFGTICMIFYLIKISTDPDDKDPDGEV